MFADIAWLLGLWVLVVIFALRFTSSLKDGKMSTHHSWVWLITAIFAFVGGSLFWCSQKLHCWYGLY